MDKIPKFHFRPPLLDGLMLAKDGMMMMMMGSYYSALLCQKAYDALEKSYARV
jgi:hypothetical protein